MAAHLKTAKSDYITIGHVIQKYMLIYAVSQHLSFCRESVLSAAPAKSGPLDFPSKKSFLFFFAHENSLGHMFQK